MTTIKSTFDNKFPRTVIYNGAEYEFSQKGELLCVLSFGDEVSPQDEAEVEKFWDETVLTIIGTSEDYSRSEYHYQKKIYDKYGFLDL